jgi:TIR domain
MSPPPTSSDDGAPPSVFICYRREDTAAHAGRLYDSMVARFGERNVFMDVDIAPGANFVDRITEVVSGCVVLILVMGPRWATAEDEDGEARLANPDDFVRLELETALRRPEVTPIPCLVSGARMPKRDELPPELHPITLRNALELSDMRWSSDVERLHSTLDVLLADTLETRVENAAPNAPEPPQPEQPTPEPLPADPPQPASRASAPSRRLVLEGMLVAAVAAYAARIAAAAVIPEGEQRSTKALSALITRTETWALVAAALAIWLAVHTGRAAIGRIGMRGLIVGAIAGFVGAVIWAVPVHILLEVRVTSTESSWLQVASLAFTGSLIGGLIGDLWRPPLAAVGVVCGALAGALFQIALIVGGWDTSHPPSTVALTMAISAAAIAGLTLAVLSRPRR